MDGVKAHEVGVRETLNLATDILVSSNFEPHLWYLATECEAMGKCGGEEATGRGGGAPVDGGCQESWGDNCFWGCSRRC